MSKVAHFLGDATADVEIDGDAMSDVEMAGDVMGDDVLMSSDDK